jgi:hypothetical protein
LIGNISDPQQVDDVQIKNRKDYLEILQKQATQFKMYTALINADEIHEHRNRAIRSSGLALEPLPGLSLIPFEYKNEFIDSAMMLAEVDINNVNKLFKSLVTSSGWKSTSSKNPYQAGKACRDGVCHETFFYRDFIQPLYGVFLKELAQSHVFLMYLNWDLTRKDFSQAIDKAIKESVQIQEMINGLRGSDRYLALSFLTTLERVIKNYPKDKARLVRLLLEVELGNQTFWKDLKKEFRKPQLWGVIGCYGVTIFTPAKFINLLCHSAGLSVSAYSLMTGHQKLERYNHMSKVQMIPTKMYDEAKYGLIVESILSALYLRTVMPDFSKTLLGRSLIVSPMTVQTRLSAQRTFVNNSGGKEVFSHTKEALDKLGLGLLFTSATQSEVLIDQVLRVQDVGNMHFEKRADLFDDKLLTIGYVCALLLKRKEQEVEKIEKLNDELLKGLLPR